MTGDPQRPSNGYGDGAEAAIGVVTANETGPIKTLISGLSKAEGARFAEQLNQYVADLYAQGGNRAIERWAPFLEGAARSDNAILKSLQQGAVQLNQLEASKLIGRVKLGPAVDIALGTASVINDYRNGDNWVSEAFKQGASAGTGILLGSAAGAGVGSVLVGFGVTGATAAAAPLVAAAVVGAAGAYAVAEAWDFVESEYGDEIGQWTTQKIAQARQLLGDLKTQSRDYLTDKGQEFRGWVNDNVEAFRNWADQTARDVEAVWNNVRGRASELGQDVVDFWRDAAASARGKADEAIAWMGDRARDVADAGQRMWESARDWAGEQFDRISDTIADVRSAIRDWGSDRLQDLRDRVNSARDGLSSVWEKLRDWFNDEPSDPSDAAEDAADRSQAARTEASPLVLDLDGDGVELTRPDGNASVYWDVDLDGMRERSGWVAPDDGLLAIDTNGNGRIDDHAELFGTLTTDGFTVLRALDSDWNGVIDARDAAFSDLRVWRDLDTNGRTDAGELLTLAQAGVRSIALDASGADIEREGNRITHVSSYVTTQGRTREIVDAWFTYDNLNTIAGGPTPFDPVALSLPNLRGYGRLPDLRTAMARDTGLRDLVFAFAATDAADLYAPGFDLVARTQAILYRWAGVQDVAPRARGQYVDGRQLAFIEAFTDRPFAQFGRPNPAPEAGRTLTTAFETLLNDAILKLVAQSSGDALFGNTPLFDWRADRFEAPLALDFAALERLAAGYRDAGAEMRAVWINLIRVVDAAVDIDALGSESAARLDGIVARTRGDASVTVEAALQVIKPPIALGLNGTNGADVLRGGGGRDVITAARGDDALLGLRGDDRLDGGPGNDTLDGGIGNDLMLGGSGDDAYIYRAGFDTIVDVGGEDTLRFAVPARLQDFAFVRSTTNGLDLEIMLRGSLVVRIERFYQADRAVETLRLADGTLFDLVRQSRGVVGSEGPDRLRGDRNVGVPTDRMSGLGGRDTLLGLLGQDALEGGAGDDWIDGGAGDDTLDGGPGADTLLGGAGDDLMRGGLGDDVYRVDGHDIAADRGGADAVALPDGVRPQDVRLSRVPGSDDLRIEAGAHSLTVQAHFSSVLKALEALVFSFDGVVRRHQIDSLSVDIVGSARPDLLRGDIGGAEQADRIRGLEGGDRIHGNLGRDTLFGGDGDDLLYGDAGADILDGEAGDDSLYGGAGGDIYRVGRGDDFISDAGAAGDAPDVLAFEAGITPAMLRYFRLPDGDLLISWTGGSARIDNAFELRRGVETLRFASGASIDVTTIAAPTIGAEAGESLSGNTRARGARNDRMEGLGGDDRLSGLDGDDTLDGGEGDDSLFGGAGSDTYIVGQGHDFVDDAGAVGDSPDTIAFRAGVTPRAVSYTRLTDGDLLIRWADGSVRIDDAWDARNGVERVRFANGVVREIDALRVVTLGSGGSERLNGNSKPRGLRDDDLRGLDGDDRLNGLDGDDTLDGGPGDDTLSGGAGGDLYRLGEGHDFIDDNGRADDRPDVIALRAGLSPSDVRYRRLPDGDLLIAWTGGSARIDNAFALRDGIETLRFANGATVDLTKQAAPTIGTGGADRLEGNNSQRGSQTDLIQGLDGDDRLNGLRGDDTLDGGAGDDTLLGGAGADIYLVGEGRDFVSDAGDAGDGPDVAEFAAGVSPEAVSYERLPDGDLVVRWATGSARIDDAWDALRGVEFLRFANGAIVDVASIAAATIGSGGDDVLSGNARPRGLSEDLILGFEGADRLNGLAGDDTLDGGEGDDSLFGGLGGDTYRVGDGADFVSDAGAAGDGPDIVAFRAGVTPETVAYERLHDGDLRVRWTGGSVRIDNAWDARAGVETLRFVDGAEIAVRSLAAPTIGSGGNDTLNGRTTPTGVWADDLRGFEGDDRLRGYNGADTLDGGEGDDTLDGGVEGDIYLIGPGSDLISEFGAVGDAPDVMMMPDGVAPGDVDLFLLDGQRLLVLWPGGAVTVEGWTNPRARLEILRFADGAEIDLTTQSLAPRATPPALNARGDASPDVLNGAEGDDRLTGLEGADTMDGGAGDDTLIGGNGGDAYLVGAGHDFIDDGGLATDPADVISFAAGVQPSDLLYARLADGDLLLRWIGGSVRIDNAFDARDGVETLRFADGAAIDVAALAIATVGTAAADTLSGNSEERGSRADELRGLAGDDRLSGLDGDDTLEGGQGDDAMTGGAGADLYRVGEGHDFIDDGGLITDGADVLELAAGIAEGDVSFSRLIDGDLLLAWAGGSARIDNGFDPRDAIETLRFGPVGRSVAMASLRFVTLGSGAGETINGNRNALGSREDELRGLGGDDRLLGHDGADTLFGGPGDDSMFGGQGGDTYLVGDGDDFIDDGGAASDAPDLIVMKPGVQPSALRYDRLPDGDLRIRWDGGSVRIDNAFDARDGVETLRFADGAAVDLAELRIATEGTGGGETLNGNREERGSRDDSLSGQTGDDRLLGHDGADTLDGGADDDTLIGGSGGDLYRVGVGDDFIDDGGRVADAGDTLELPAELRQRDVTFTRLADGDLRLAWSGGSVRIDNGFDAADGVETLRFGAAGPSIDLHGLNFATVGSNGAETLRGNREERGSRDDRISGLDGDDVLFGLDGRDTLDGGPGDDSLHGSSGDDVYVASSGGDLIDEQSGGGADTILFNAREGDASVSFAREGLNDLRISWSGGEILVRNHYLDADNRIESLAFLDDVASAILF